MVMLFWSGSFLEILLVKFLLYWHLSWDDLCGGSCTAMVGTSAAAANSVIFEGSVQLVYFVVAVWVSFKFGFCVSRLVCLPSVSLVDEVYIESLLSSVSVFSTDLKWIQTPHTLFLDFRADRTFLTRWSASRDQVWVQVRVPAWQSPQKAIPVDKRRFWLQNQWPSSWAVWTGKHRHRVFPSILQSFPSQPKPHTTLCSIFLSFFGFWVKIWHRNNSTYFKLNHVHSSISKLMTCQNKGRLLNSTETSDGSEQKLGNDVWHNPESIATKFAAKLVASEMLMFESHGAGSPSWGKRCQPTCCWYWENLRTPIFLSPHFNTHALKHIVHIFYLTLPLSPLMNLFTFVH